MLNSRASNADTDINSKDLLLASLATMLLLRDRCWQEVRCGHSLLLRDRY